MNFFTVGSKFSSYEALKSALDQYKKETCVEFNIRDCKPIERMIKHKVQRAFMANKSLVYYSLKLTCARGGRPFVSCSLGYRKTHSWRCGCEAFIDLRLSRCGQYLQVKDYDFEHNHEIGPRPLKRTEYRAERRRLRLMKELKISYMEAMQLDNAKQKLAQEKKDSVSKEGTKGAQSKEDSFSDTENNNNAEKKDDCFSNEENNNAQNKEYPSSNKDNDYAENNDDHFSKEDSDSDVNVKYNKVTYVSSRKRPQIYTRAGDYGMSSTFSGNWKQKDDSIFEALGTVEELSSAIGFAVEFLPESCDSVNIELREIQCVLQDLAVRVGTPKSSSTPFHEANCEFPDTHITNLEFWIDNLVESLPELDSIILPSGGKGSSALHVARTICRRAERRVVGLVRNKEVDDTTVRYLNRLGDYLFVAARVVCLASGEKECIYKKPELRQKGYEIIYLSRLTQSIA